MAYFLEENILYNSTIPNSKNKYKIFKYSNLNKKMFLLKMFFNDSSH